MAVIKHLVNLDLSKNQLLNAVVQNLAAAPSSPVDGQIYWDTTVDSLFVWSAGGSTWIDLGSDGITNLSYTAGVSNGVVTSSTGTNATIPLADATNAGLFSAVEKTKLGGIEVGAQVNVATNISEGAVTTTSVGLNSSTGTNATLAQANSTRAGVLSSAKFDEIEANTLKVSDINHNVTTNISINESSETQVVVQSSDGTDGTITAASTSKAGVMTKAMFDKLDGIEAGAQIETLTSISLAANTLTYTDEDGVDTNIDLSLYLDDTNLARLTSGSINGSTGLATFTRDDASTFTIDMSAFLDAITLNNTLTSTSTTEGLTAAQGKVLKDLIDALPTENTQRSDEEIRDVAAAQWTNGTNTTVVVDDVANTIKINSVDTNTQLSDGDVGAFGYIKGVAWDEIGGTQSDISLSDFNNDMNISGTNTGDEPDASTTVKGIIEIATNTEANAGTLTNRAITPANLKNVLGTTATLATTLTYSELIGNGTLTSIVVTHNIGNQFVQAQVFEVAGMDKVECEIELTSSTTTTFKFNVAPASNALRVVIIG